MKSENNSKYHTYYSKLNIRNSCKKDISMIMSLIEQSRGIMRSIGDFSQWVNYPTIEQIEKDILSSCSYIIEQNTTPIATFAFIPSPEPTYNKIYNGNWISNGKYYVIHRIAKDKNAKGIFKIIMDYCFSKTNDIRIDTHSSNIIMQYLLKTYGFQYCGIIHLENGDERLAFEKIMD